MAQTIAQKILRNHALMEVAEVKPGEFIRARVDLTLLNDVNGPMAFRHFEKMGGTKVASPDKLALARKLGATHTINSKECDAVGEILKVCWELEKLESVGNLVQLTDRA